MNRKMIWLAVLVLPAVLTVCIRDQKASQQPTEIQQTEEQKKPQAELALRQIWEQTYPQYDFEGDFTWETSRDGLIITGYLGEKKDVRIPSQIQGLPVTGIGKGAFQGRRFVQERSQYSGCMESKWVTGHKIASVTIPNSVSYIGEN